MFFTAVGLVHEHLTEEQPYDVTQPRVVPCKSKWQVHQNAVYWVNLPVKKKGSTFYHRPMQSSFMTLSQQTAWQGWCIRNQRQFCTKSAYLTPQDVIHDMDNVE